MLMNHDSTSVTLTVFKAISQYRYNALGQRVSKTVEGITTYFVYGQSGELLAEMDQHGKPIREHIYLNGKPLAQNHYSGETATTYYLHNDHLGRPVMATDSQGNEVWSVATTPFGQIAHQTGTVKQPLQFPGQYKDDETGLSYNYYRDYDPATGRYVQSDLIGLAGGMNTYGYVGGNPVNYIDPMGLAGFLGAEISGGNGLGLGGGIVLVTCTDECDEMRTFVYMKVCGGLTTPGISAAVTGGGVSNMEGKQCRPENYEGYFAEANFGGAGMGGGIDAGLTDSDGNLIPDGLSETNEAGIGMASPGISAMLCYYIYMGEK